MNTYTFDHMAKTNDVPSWVNKTVGATVKKEYTWGFPNRNPAVVVTVFTNGFAELEYVQTGKIISAHPKGVQELFGMARRIWSSFKSREYRMY